eukprot:CAMPEP_0172430840 /NCGR_PEP_ID=MMETSP1064-20121228/56229_1 /TAXON_ID=202472 /ORGANISM="Aulacoseira subarctica , Strain CCAP 1002/5" /LENGTH=67 /DNA_ID=CAMNT_0013177209 /DNA_START=52 /DNA_END=252 /DNA_ORIENTATION=+
MKLFCLLHALTFLCLSHAAPQGMEMALQRGHMKKGDLSKDSTTNFPTVSPAPAYIEKVGKKTRALKK